MSDYIYHIGDDYDCNNKEYVVLSTDKGQQITVALAASGVPFKGRYDKERILFDYDADYKESVDEIIENLTSDNCADIRREIEEHRRDKDYLFLSFGRLCRPLFDCSCNRHRGLRGFSPDKPFRVYDFP